ncbi:DUF3575 domain-containing protein [Riemerella columbina]|uniref:DUF3575 domain-containing protein n=1 Tax=Riemerella columbina TaxID=103810 RepID=UPI0003780B9D|nr:DUF3575 domain-containing protein [Riemerella columbina]
MKKLFLVGALALFGAVNAQQNSVKVNPFALLGGTDMVTYERAISGNSSVGLGGGIGGFKIGDVKYSNAGGTIFYRYYFNEALKGWYGMGSVAYSGGTVKYTDGFNNKEEKQNFSSFGGGVKAGYQWLWNSGFTLDLNAGLGYSSFNYDSNESSNNIALKASGVLPMFGVALGYSF